MSSSRVHSPRGDSRQLTHPLDHPRLELRFDSRQAVIKLASLRMLVVKRRCNQQGAAIRSLARAPLNALTTSSSLLRGTTKCTLLRRLHNQGFTPSTPSYAHCYAESRSGAAVRHPVPPATSGNAQQRAWAQMRAQGGQERVAWRPHQQQLARDRCGEQGTSSPNSQHISSFLSSAARYSGDLHFERRVMACRRHRSVFPLPFALAGRRSLFS